MAVENQPTHNQSFLAASEQRLVHSIICSIPAEVTPFQLTRLGLLGAVIAAAGLIGCRWSPVWLLVVTAGIFLNWFGIRLDGPLARLRKEESPRLELIDHLVDFFSQTLMIFAFGLSPFLSLKSASIILFCYMFFSAYTYLRAVAHRVQQMAYIGLGATEFRILMIIWAFAASAIGVDETAINGVSKLDSAIMILAAIAVCGLFCKVVLDARHIASRENETGA